MESCPFDSSILAKLPDLRELPSYTVPEAAHNLGLPRTTVSAWVFGMSTGRPGDKRHFDAVIAPPPQQGVHRLSYYNLAEVFVLRALRKRHRMPLNLIRDALDKVRDELQIDRPLLHEGFKTDGVRLFLETLGGTTDLQSGQRTLFDAHLGRIEWEGRLAARLYPFVSATEEKEGPRPVVIDIRRAFGRPVVDRIGVPTEELFSRWSAGDSIDEIVSDFRCRSDDVEAALRYECRDRAA
jgi:uncharacterized protein (DUF433 family)